MKHPGHMYGGFVPAISERGMTERSPNNTFHVEVVGELTTKFQKLEERHLRLDQPTARICDLLLGPPPSRAQ
jgi:hypothetical protein